ncbi:dynein axonemal assembly factor 5-like [Solea solea]|uniref:dynein axonemal assembly factor 5-like n=1 Tax=Solea solea TaxID=90069 RepID=UPI00272A7C5A|nr:dynein axonemal assembly factor 5-like [Solea solea]XP_058510584.1 dynein axonemal assembly factor 5-like [Solea solea]
MAAGDKQHAAGEVLRALARHLNCLNEDNKSTRKRAIEQIKRETVDKGLSSCVLQEVFSALLKPLLKCLSDPNEGCRETAIAVITEFIRCVPKPEESLPYLMPCLAVRLGEKEIREPAEELRLSAMEMLTLTVEVCGKHLAPYLSDVMNILQRTIVDPFPDVKRESCRCTVKFSDSVSDHFHMQAESLVKPLMQTISHQHSRVRVSVIEATRAVIHHGTGKNVDDVLSHMAQRLFDDSPQVRKAVTAVVGDWLLHMRDRYSYFRKLIPLLLSSVNDEIPEIRLLAADLWRQVGAQWEKENENELKDKMDFLLTPPEFYPPGVERPGLGCRELVIRNLGSLLPAIGNDINDWLVPTRVRTSQLLSVLLLHAEDHSTQHLQPLLTTIYRACTDAERDVANNCLAAAKLLGTFVPPAVFLKLLLDHVTSPCSSSHPWTSLMVLTAVLAGCSKPLLKPHLEQIANTLAQPDVCQEYQQVMYLEQLLACVDVLLRQCESDCGSVSLQLLQVLVTVQSLSTDTDLSEKASESVRCLCKVQDLESVMDLYRQHMAQLLDWLSASVNTWSSYSPQRLQLHVVVTQSGPVIGEFVSQLMPLLHRCLQPDKDAEMRLRVFTMLAKLLLDAANTLDSQGHFRDESDKFLCDVLLPNLVWHAGRTAAAVRTSAISCLLALLHGGAITPGMLLCLEEKLRPRVLSALEEDSAMGRLLACRSVSTILRLIGDSLHPDALNKIYRELLKRLDDSSGDVRGVALQALDKWLSSLNKDYDPQLLAPHLQLLFQQLLLHMDDPDSTVQDQVFDILKKGSSVHPALLQKEVEAVRDKHRSPLYCERLLQHISSLSTDMAADCPE